MSWAVRWRLAVLLAILFVVVAGYLAAVQDPLVRRADVALPDWPAGVHPVTIALIGDTHMSDPDMTPARLTRLVGRVNALSPDIILVAGDFISDKATSARRYTPAEAIEPLGGLRAPLGVFAVLGNHDGFQRAETAAALAVANITLLTNSVARAGPLLIAGLGDFLWGEAHPSLVEAALAGRQGPVVAFAHSPDIAPVLRGRLSLLLAAHTHCGQVRLPWLGALKTASIHGQRYGCGVIREGRRTVIVTAGLGTSRFPIRIGAPPDLWLVTVGPGVSRR